jgi:hypothetical protein
LLKVASCNELFVYQENYWKWKNKNLLRMNIPINWYVLKHHFQSLQESMYILKYLLSFSKISTFNCVSRQVINEKSRGGDLAIDKCIASSPDITCMIYMFCWLITNNSLQLATFNNYLAFQSFNYEQYLVNFTLSSTYIYIYTILTNIPKIFEIGTMLPRIANASSCSDKK